MTEEKALNAVEKAIDKAYDKGKKLPIDIVIERFSNEKLQTNKAMNIYTMLCEVLMMNQRI